MVIDEGRNVGPCESQGRLIGAEMMYGRLLLPADPAGEVTSPETAAQIALSDTIYKDLGPVLAVADLGDMWRVYRSKHRYIMSPPYVPWLVDKRTGDLIIESLPRKDGPTAQEGMAELLALVDPQLRDWGFTGRKRRWRYATPTDTKIMTIYTASGASRVSLEFQFVLTNVSFAYDNGFWGVGEGVSRGRPTRFYVLAGVPVQPMADLILESLENQLLPLLTAEP